MQSEDIVGPQEMIQLAQGGPFLALLAFMIWDKTQERKASKERDDAHLMLAKERIQTDLEVALSMTALAAKIEGLR